MSEARKRMSPGRALATLVVLVAAAAWQAYTGGDATPSAPPKVSPEASAPRGDAILPGPGDRRAAPPTPTARADARRPALPVDSTIEDAYRAGLSDQIVQERGRVKVVLRDDNEGSRHQRWIVDIGGGRTVLIAHNIDLAPRVPVDRGDWIEFRGEYEWNEKGGVVHWTHHDPQDRHDHGWIEHDGQRYQ